MPKYRFDEIAINSTEKKKPAESDKELYIGLEHLDSGCLEVTRWGAEVAPIGDKLVMRKGDVLFGRRRAYQKKVAIAPFDGIFSAHGMVLRPVETVINKEFFPFFISSDYFLDAAIKISVGSLSPTINWRDLAKLEFLIPTLEEQKILTGVLWAINRLKVAYKSLLQQIDDLVQSQFVEMFGDPEIEEQKYPLKNLSETCSIIQDGEHAAVKRVDEGHLFISARNIKVDHSIVLDTVTYVDDEIYEKIRKRFSPEAGDVLLTCAGTIGNVAIVPVMEPFVADRGLTMLRAKKDMLLPEYLLLCLVSNYVQNQMRQGTHATALAHLYLNKIRNISIVVPPLSKQEEFVSFLKQTDKSKLAIRQALDSLEKSRNAIIKEIFG